MPPRLVSLHYEERMNNILTIKCTTVALLLVGTYGVVLYSGNRSPCYHASGFTSSSRYHPYCEQNLILMHAEARRWAFYFFDEDNRVFLNQRMLGLPRTCQYPSEPATTHFFICLHRSHLSGRMDTYTNRYDSSVYPHSLFV